MHVIETERLILRAPQEADAEALMRIHQDPEVVPSITLAAPVGDVTLAWRNVALMLGHWQLRGYGQWSVVEKQTGDVIGRVGLWNPAGWPGVELGWVIDRSRWGNGFATEAAREVIRWAWANTGVRRIISIITPGSSRSISVALKIGQRFEREGIFNNGVVHIYCIDKP